MDIIPFCIDWQKTSFEGIYMQDLFSCWNERREKQMQSLCNIRRVALIPSLAQVYDSTIQVLDVENLRAANKL